MREIDETELEQVSGGDLWELAEELARAAYEAAKQALRDMMTPQA